LHEQLKLGFLHEFGVPVLKWKDINRGRYKKEIGKNKEGR
jgi:hypothetical protein